MSRFRNMHLSIFLHLSRHIEKSIYYIYCIYYIDYATFRSSVDIDDMLKLTPRQIEEMYKGSQSGNKIIKQINKTFEGRDLSKGN